VKGAASSAGSLLDLFGRAAARAPEKIAIRFRDGEREETITYTRLFGRARAAAAELARRGVRPGDRVALFVDSAPELVVSWLAALGCGAALLPINLAYRRREIAHLLTDAGPRLLVVGRARAASIAELDERERAGAGVVEAEELAGLAGDATGWPASPGPDDPALVMYTSGTTGASKGAVLTHSNVLAMVASLHEAWRWSADDALLLTLPLFHMHGLVNGLHCALAAGASVELEPRFEAARAVDRLARGDATLFFGVPTLYVRLVEELRRRGDRVSFPRVRLFVSGSAPLAPETFAAFEELTGQRILERYGMTETGMLLGNPLDGERRAGTVGLPMPGVEVRVVDDAGEAVDAGEEGEVEVRGPNVFSGYWRAPGKSAASFRVDAVGRSWFRTGDRGRIDPGDGYLTLLGRSSELILSGGFNVYPREVEEVLLRFPGVREAAVVGEPHPEFGESPVAHLVADDDLDFEALAAHCRAELAAFKLPRRFVLAGSLPRNALGKVEKHRLRSG